MAGIVSAFVTFFYRFISFTTSYVQCVRSIIAEHAGPHGWFL
ncbi:hypothetical protein TPCCA_0811 [Treponema paraluiscuniculi Cuniculi A]|uniref:Uncharacterized protein TP_0811 n=4 Tax=Treponema TaxID=157 RepID=Y811_TREPA|nr:RecName: Full=Uncharacterized protein TP_0811 [Treponema pallidum subsp. pallidum str. Nichols]ACD71229.1 hypothetical protein TPASS_0811 [Treponema pallidum subsp. pallidum SS14]ADD72902.1 conserved hypothetical protein [Treponema pallidum subsp. pallidum str. Chicago]AEH40737.1 hypothetical protein TPCCA_0811 [Treponema paraluiscuniculi Cuniculi A]WKC72666.1 hypothetical protein TPLL2_0811 [Treponema paraluiscuniculi]AAC65784.1 predicted coding region TP0811 [Treponema pallidum subsp. pal